MIYLISLTRKFNFLSYYSESRIIRFFLLSMIKGIHFFIVNQNTRLNLDKYKVCWNSFLSIFFNFSVKKMHKKSIYTEKLSYLGLLLIAFNHNIY